MCFSRPKFWVHVAQILVVCAVALSCVTPCAAQDRLSLEAQIAPATPDRVLASEMFGVSGRVDLLRQESPVPGWRVSTPDGANLGYIGSSWEIARTVGYSGRPIDMLVAITSDAKIASAKLMAHSEPILTLGLSDSDIEDFVQGFSGVDLNDPTPSLDTTQKNQLDIISRATVSTGVIRDAILRVGRELALSRGILDQGRIDRLVFSPRTSPMILITMRGAMVSKIPQWPFERPAVPAIRFMESQLIKVARAGFRACSGKGALRLSLTPTG
ncbi:FMN-binding protein [Shimia litoralis]|uniref:FMN-binding protein n=1 Tax=Shimia litoralis TaxID=420403 RepID=A0A4U7MW64_9RHOB|nr:FMN-binding protein [Shimia litoralis]